MDSKNPETYVSPEKLFKGQVLKAWLSKERPT